MKKNATLLVLPIEEISFWPELSSPARFRIKGGGVPWALRRRSLDGRTEILVSNIG